MNRQYLERRRRKKFKPLHATALFNSMALDEARQQLEERCIKEDYERKEREEENKP